MADTSRETMLTELAALCGVEPSYTDVAGKQHTTSPETQAAILTAMGCRCQTAAELNQELARRRGRPWTELLEPVLALHQSELPAAWSLYLPLPEGELPGDLEVAWELCDEGGGCFYSGSLGPGLHLSETRRVGPTDYGRVLLPLPPYLDWGYYGLTVRVDSARLRIQRQMFLIIAPDRVYMPEVVENSRLWGLNLPLYAVRSRRNWGIGDCGDLQRFLAWGGKLGAGLIGLNPLHHLGVNLHDSISPYYPTSRGYSNPLYLDLERVPEMALCPEAREFLARPDIQAHLESLRQSPQVNYPEVAGIKSAVLEKLLDALVQTHGGPHAPRTQRGRDFAAFLEQEGEPLRHFAAFLALSEHWQAEGKNYLAWQQWPEAYHDPDGPAVTVFVQSHERQLLVHAYAQWLLADQFQACQAMARDHNLPLGLYLDLAVGVNPGGFDTWANQDLFAPQTDIGAPPDDFSPLGQNWGLAPLLPEQLRRQGYRYFIHLLRQNCPVGGAVRLDHVMGLFRLFWIPQGSSPAQGAYVSYPAEDMLKILALESVRRQTAIIGEDLGTVAPYIRERLTAYQVLSTRLFYFERRWDGAFCPAQDYPDWALASITTHDLPTLAGFWQGRDIYIREQLNLFPDALTAERAREDRRQAKLAIIELLRQKGWLSEAAAGELATETGLPDQVKWQVIAHLAETPCRLVLLSLEDIFGWLDQQNLPGTKDEYPNWRLKLPLLLEDLEGAAAPAEAAGIMRRFRKEE